MKLDTRKIKTGEKYILKEDVNLDKFFEDNNLSINKINYCKTEITAWFNTYLIVFKFKILCSLNLNDYKTNEPFDKEFVINDKVIFSDKEEDEISSNYDEIVMFNTNLIIDLDEIIYSLIVTNLPIKISKN